MTRFTLSLLLVCLLGQACSRKSQTNRADAGQSIPGQSPARRGEVLFLGNTGKHLDSG